MASQAEAQKQGGVAAANWIDGIAFTFGEFPETSETIQEKLKGRLHKAVVFYTETSYQAEKKTQVSGCDSVVRLVKAENSPDFVNPVKFLKGFKPEASTSAKAEMASG